MLDQVDSPVDGLFRALSDSTRRAIIERLDDGPLGVTQLAEPFDMTLAAVAQHVQVLEKSGLISTTKVGRRRICRLDLEGIATASRWLDQRRAHWETRLDRLESILGSDSSSPHEECP